MPTQPDSVTLRARPLRQFNVASCGAAAAARLVSAVRPTALTAHQETEVEKEIFAAVNDQYHRPNKSVPAQPRWYEPEDSGTNEPEPPRYWFDPTIVQKWGSTPAALEAALDHALSVASPGTSYRLVARQQSSADQAGRKAPRLDVISGVVGSVDAGWPAILLTSYGQHWVLVVGATFGRDPDGKDWGNLEILSPSVGGATGVAMWDLSATIHDADKLAEPIRGGDVLVGHFVAAVVDGAAPHPIPAPLVTPPIQGPVPDLVAVERERRRQAVAALSRFAVIDPARWAPIILVPPTQVVRIERLTRGATALDLVAFPGADPGLVRAVVLLDARTGAVVEGAAFLNPQRLLFTTGRGLRWGPCVESTTTWMAFYTDGANGAPFERVDGQLFPRLTPLGGGY